MIGNRAGPANPPAGYCRRSECFVQFLKCPHFAAARPASCRKRRNACIYFNQQRTIVAHSALLNGPDGQLPVQAMKDPHAAKTGLADLGGADQVEVAIGIKAHRGLRKLCLAQSAASWLEQIANPAAMSAKVTRPFDMVDKAAHGQMRVVSANSLYQRPQGRGIVGALAPSGEIGSAIDEWHGCAEVHTNQRIAGHLVQQPLRNLQP